MPNAHRVGSWITHERLDDEVIAINMETGAYFALEGTAAECWSLAAAGVRTDAIVEVLVARFDVSAPDARRDLEALLEQLRAEALLAASEPVEHPPPVTPHTPRAPYSTPVLEKYDDLEELLLLDPIHEVDDAGWPVITHDAG